MIEAVTAILGLFCGGIFLAHAIDAYRGLSAQGFDTPPRPNDRPETAWSHSSTPRLRRLSMSMTFPSLWQAAEKLGPKCDLRNNRISEWPDLKLIERFGRG